MADQNRLSHKFSASRIVITILGVVLFAATWFWIAGGLNWWQGLAFLLAFIVFTGLLFWRMSRVNPDLVRERNRPAEVAEPWDRAVMGIYSVLLVMLMILAALDGGRYHWSDIPLVVQATGWVLLVIACAIVWHVMMTNAYLSSWARIQDDRGQVVVRDGLYGYIRHPMYAGILIAFLALPMVLNSWWSMIPAVLIIGIFIYRTYREDRMLLESLEGYAEYQQEVRYRLIPGIW